MSAKESAIGLDYATALAPVSAGDKGRMKVRWIIEKYLGDFKDAKDIPKDLKPFEVVEFEHNLLVNVGINQMWTLIAGTGGTEYDNTHAYIGVGDSATAAQATDTGLNGTNKTFKAMDTSYPTYGSSQYATWRSTFGSGDANYAWNEICVANGNNPPTTGVMLNHKVQSMGTKASGKIHYII
jgi:hypothetical protein